jgi:hypothetical protein
MKGDQFWSQISDNSLLILSKEGSFDRQNGILTISTNVKNLSSRFWYNFVAIFGETFRAPTYSYMVRTAKYPYFSQKKNLLSVPNVRIFSVSPPNLPVSKPPVMKSEKPNLASASTPETKIVSFKTAKIRPWTEGRDMWH